MLRHAQISDLPAIVSIYNQTVAGRMVTADTEPVAVESKQNWFYSHSRSRPLWVWENDNEIKAWVSFKDFYGRPAYRHTAEISIYIDENLRSVGLGSYLLDHALQQCPHLEIKTLLGYIFAHNQPSLGLFYKFGFENWAHFPEVALLDGNWYDLLIVGKKV